MLKHAHKKYLIATAASIALIALITLITLSTTTTQKTFIALIGVLAALIPVIVELPRFIEIVRNLISPQPPLAEIENDLLDFIEKIKTRDNSVDSVDLVFKDIIVECERLGIEAPQ